MNKHVNKVRKATGRAYRLHLYIHISENNILYVRRYLFREFLVVFLYLLLITKNVVSLFFYID